MKTKILAYFQICISVALSMPVVIIFTYALEPNQDILFVTQKGCKNYV